jgi:acylphosphatase
MPIVKRCLVSGRVQGVFYRASTQQQARKLGITGYAKNLTDGRVEVLAVGDAARVDALVQWLWQGPPAAHVICVDETELGLVDLVEVPAQFTTV